MADVPPSHPPAAAVPPSYAPAVAEPTPAAGMKRPAEELASADKRLKADHDAAEQLVATAAAQVEAAAAVAVQATAAAAAAVAAAAHQTEAPEAQQAQSPRVSQCLGCFKPLPPGCTAAWCLQCNVTAVGAAGAVGAVGGVAAAAGGAEAEAAVAAIAQATAQANAQATVEQQQAQAQAQQQLHQQQAAQFAQHQQMQAAELIAQAVGTKAAKPKPRKKASGADMDDAQQLTEVELTQLAQSVKAQVMTLYRRLKPRDPSQVFRLPATLRVPDVHIRQLLDGSGEVVIPGTTRLTAAETKAIFDLDVLPTATSTWLRVDSADVKTSGASKTITILAMWGGDHAPISV